MVPLKYIKKNQNYNFNFSEKQKRTFYLHLKIIIWFRLFRDLKLSTICLHFDYFKRKRYILGFIIA